MKKIKIKKIQKKIHKIGLVRKCINMGREILQDLKGKTINQCYNEKVQDFYFYMFELRENAENNSNMINHGLNSVNRN